MKTIKLMPLAIAAVLTCGFGSTILAADNSVASPPRERFFQRLADKLNLSDAQRSQIKTVMAGEKDTLRSLAMRLHETRKNLRATIQSPSANETSVRAVSAKVAAVEADLAVERMKIFGKISPVLTEEQRRQISDLEQHVDDFVDSAIMRIGDGLAE